MPARVPPPFFFIGLKKEVNMLALLIDRGAGKRTIGEGEDGFSVALYDEHHEPSQAAKRKEGSMHNGTVEGY